MERQYNSLYEGRELRWPQPRRRRWRSETEASVPPGFNFTPKDEELIIHYLRRYARTGGIPWDHVVEDGVYATEPWELLGDDRDVGYFFTKRTRSGHGSGRVSRTAGRGTWTGQAKKENVVSADGRIIGFKAMFSYCVNAEEGSGGRSSRKSTGYVMYEYELPPQSNNYYKQEAGAPLQQPVLCCVKKSAQEIARSNKRRRAQAAASAAVGDGGGKRAHYDGDLEVASEGRDFNSGAIVATAAENATSSQEYAGADSIELSITREAPVAAGVPSSRTGAAVCSPTSARAAAASMEVRENTDALDLAAVDQQPLSYRGGYWTALINADISDTREGDGLKTATAAPAATAEHHLPPLSGQDGDQPMTTAASADLLGWMELLDFRELSPLPAFDWEMTSSRARDLLKLPPQDLLMLMLPLADWEMLRSSDLPKPPPESAPAGVATSAAGIGGSRLDGS